MALYVLKVALYVLKVALKCEKLRATPILMSEQTDPLQVSMIANKVTLKDNSNVEYTWLAVVSSAVESQYITHCL